MSDLKPCPFCGSGNLVYNSASGRNTGRFVRCNDCNACGPLAEDDALARAAWNGAPRWDEVMELPRDADGVLIRIGDVLYAAANGNRVTVGSIGFRHDGTRQVVDKFDDAFYWAPSLLTHTKPDTLETIEASIRELIMVTKGNALLKIPDLVERIKRMVER